MYLDEIKYGIILIAGNGFMFYNLVKTGSHIEIVELYNSEVKLQKKHKKGGSSAARYGRIKQEKDLHYVKKVSEKMVDYYMIENKTRFTVNGIIVGGPAQMKYKVLECPETVKMLGSKIIKVVDTAEINFGVAWEVYERCLQELATDEEKDIVKLITTIKELMLNASDKLVYGIKEITENLNMCNLERILISSELDNEMKESIYDLSKKCNCEIIEANPHNSKSIGIDCIGIKWY